MAKSAYRRDRKYRRKISDTEHMAKQLELAKDDMAAAYAHTQAELTGLEEATREVLGKYDVSSIVYPGYLNFVRQVWKMRKKFSGDTFTTEARILIDKWTSRKLERKVLEDILYLMFASKGAPKDKDAEEK